MPGKQIDTDVRLATESKRLPPQSFQKPVRVALWFSVATDSGDLRYNLVDPHHVINREIDNELQIIEFVHDARHFEAVLSDIRVRPL